MSSLKSFTGFNLEKAGFSEERLVYARQQYDKMIEMGLGELDKSGVAELTFLGRGGQS